MDKTLIEMLEKIGLSQLEAEVYLRTLMSKKGTAYDISRLLKTRTSVYTALEKLKKRGLVSSSLEKNKTIYTAKDINHFINEKKYENDIIYKNILTLSSHLVGAKHTGIQIFKGEKDLRVALSYGISKKNKETPSPIYCIYPSSSTITISPKDTIYYNWNTKLHSYGYTKIILSDEKVKSEYIALDKELGFMRATNASPFLRQLSQLAIGVELYKDDGIIKLFFYKESLILVIENKDLACFCATILRTSINPQ